MSTADIFEYLTNNLEDKAFDGPPLSNNRVVEMFSAATDAEDQRRIQIRFGKKGGSLKVVVATIAFGMGIDIPDIDVTVQWGLPRSPLQFWQQAGRAGRDGRMALSISYIFKRSVHLCTDKTMQALASDDEATCIRAKLLNVFSVNEAMCSELEKLKSATVCECASISDKEDVCNCPACQCCIVCVQQ